MRTRLWLAATIWLACNGNKDEDQPDEADADADADADTDADTDADADVPQRGYLRFANLAEGYGTADLWVDTTQGQPAISLDPLTGTDWRELQPGEHRFAVSPEGEPVEPEVDPSQDLTVVEGTRYSLLLYGDAATPGMVYIEDEIGGLDPEQIRYAVLNGAPGLTSIDLWDATNQVSMVSDLAYGEVAFDEGDLNERIVWVDLERDGVWDQAFTIPSPNQDGVTLHLYLVWSDSELKLAVYSPNANLTVLDPEPLLDPDTGTEPTGDTGDTVTETADTGDAVTETADTGSADTADTGSSASTGDTGP